MDPGCIVHRSSTSPGSSTAAVPTTTRAAPASRSDPAASALRTPPPAWMREATVLAIASMTARFAGSPVRAASRSTTWIHSAPASAKVRATLTGFSS